MQLRRLNGAVRKISSRRDRKVVKHTTCDVMEILLLDVFKDKLGEKMNNRYS